MINCLFATSDNNFALLNDLSAKECADSAEIMLLVAIPQKPDTLARAINPCRSICSLAVITPSTQETFRRTFFLLS